jgi:prolipoprotein diacylglyceryltransferase
MLQIYAKVLASRINNEKGAEIVEWVLWVGGMVVLGGIVLAALTGSIGSKVDEIINTIAPLTS